MLIAAHCNTDDTGPVVTELHLNDETYYLDSKEFPDNASALLYWATLNLKGYLIWDDGRLYVGAQLFALDMSMGPDLTLLTLIFDEDEEANLSVVVPSSFAAENIPGFIVNIPKKPQETLEHHANVAIGMA